MTRLCTNCTYWQPKEFDVFHEKPSYEAKGYCHKYPKSEETKGDWWCGEFKGKCQTPEY